MRAQAIRPALPLHHRRSGDTWFPPAALLVLAMVLLGAGLLYLSQASSVATGGYDLLRLEAERTRWEIANSQIRYRVAELSSISRVASEARERLEMGPPVEVLYLEVR